MALIDSGADENFISRAFVKESDLTIAGEGPGLVKSIHEKEEVCYGTVKLPAQFTDSTQRQRRDELECLVIDMPGLDIVLGYPWLEGVNPVIDWRERSWRFRYNLQNIQIIKPQNFKKELRRAQGYALLPRVQLASVAPELPKQFSDYADVFSEREAESLPPLEGRQHAIETVDGAEPPYGPIYNLSETELSTLREYLETSEEKGWIRRSVSPAGAPILFVPKADGSLRLCVDYRGLNKITIKNRHPLPLIGETLDRLRGAKVFTKLDLRNAYYRVRIRPGDEWKTAFRTRYGHFEYQVMPFGLANAPATFQAFINRALEGLLDISCVVYLDDILIYSGDPTEHEDHVREVLERLRRFGLYAKLSKCEFFTQSVEFLGYVVSTAGISMEVSRVDTITAWPIPRSFRDVQVFLGFANFYRRFISGYSGIARPLTGLLKGSQKGKKSGPFEWGPQEQAAFDQLKKAFVTAPVLAHFDPAKPGRVETDASGQAISGIFSQPEEWPAKDGLGPVWHPVAFFSRKMEPAEINYGTPDQELLAIVKSFEHWRHYLEGSQHPIEVITDHDNLRYFATTKELSRRQARWSLAMQAYDFLITHRPGKKNPADGPSRRPDYMSAPVGEDFALPTLRRKLQVARERGLLLEREELPDHQRGAGEDSVPAALVIRCGDLQPSLHVGKPRASPANDWSLECSLPRVSVAKAMETEDAYASPSNSFLPVLTALQLGDALAVEKRAELEGDHDPATGWSIDGEGLLRYEAKAYVPRDAAVRAEIMKICHDDPLAGHFGQRKTIALVRRKYYWPSMARDIRAYVTGCDICQRVKTPRQRKAGEMVPLGQPEYPFQSITLDFITDLPPSTDEITSEVFDALLVIVDRYTKRARYIPCSKTIDAPAFARLFVKHWFKDQGLPASIVSDRGSIFASKFWSALCYHLRVDRNLSTAFHPQTDGQTERQNQTLETWLRSYVCYMQDDWVNLLPLAEFAYNNAFHDSIGCSPNEACYGKSLDTRQGIANEPLRGEVPTAKERATQIVEVRQELENNWRKTKEQQAKWYNQNRRPVEYNIGTQVLLSSKNIRTVRISKKLDHRFLGPFTVTERIGKQAYRLKLPPKYSRLHDVFHVVLLKEYHQPTGNPPEIFQPDLIDGEEEWEIESLLDKRVNRNKLEYLVRWRGYGPADDQWIQKSELKHAMDLVREFEARQAPATPRRSSNRKKKDTQA